MANPQLENGYIRISSEIWLALARINLSPYEARVMRCILAKTYGFNKKEDWITLSQFAEFTCLDKRLVSRALRKLSSKKMINIKRKNKRVVVYGLQKDYEKWDGVVIPIDDKSKKVIIQTDDKLSSKQMTHVIQTDDKSSSIQTTTKDNT